MIVFNIMRYLPAAEVLSHAIKIMIPTKHSQEQDEAEKRSLIERCLNDPKQFQQLVTRCAAR